jgi:hypothetical protein
MNKTYKLENGISTLEKDDEEIHLKNKANKWKTR